MSSETRDCGCDKSPGVGVLCHSPAATPGAPHPCPLGSESGLQMWGPIPRGSEGLTLEQAQTRGIFKALRVGHLTGRSVERATLRVVGSSPRVGCKSLRKIH